MLDAYLKLSTESLEHTLPETPRLGEHLDDVPDVRRGRVHEVGVIVHALGHHASSRRPAMETSSFNLTSENFGRVQ